MHPWQATIVFWLSSIYSHFSRPNVDDSATALTEFRTQAIIVEYMIRNVDVFFDKDLASAAIAYYPEKHETSIEGMLYRYYLVRPIEEYELCIALLSPKMQAI